MSSQTAALLKAFDALPECEKRIFTAEFLRRAVLFEFGHLDDNETAHASDRLFALLDAEENDAKPNILKSPRNGWARKGRIVGDIVNCDTSTLWEVVRSK
jgi:hypothetical protein